MALLRTETTSNLQTVKRGITMRVIVCGDRNWHDYHAIEGVLSNFRKGTIIIHGAARGADSLADLAAKQLGFERIPFPAKWEELGKKAGIVRNQQMLDEGKPDRVIAFHDNIEKSKGTKDMIQRAQKAEIKNFIWTHEILKDQANVKETPEQYAKTILMLAVDEERERLYTGKLSKDERDISDKDFLKLQEEVTELRNKIAKLLGKKEL